MYLSARITSERQYEQPLDEVENIIKTVKRSRSTNSRRISMQLNIPHTLCKYAMYPFHLRKFQPLEPLQGYNFVNG